MGGKVLEYEAKTIFNQGIEQGIEQAARKLLSKGYTCEEVAEDLDIALEKVKQLQNEIHNKI